MAEEQRQEGTAEWQNDLRQEEGLSDRALFVVTRDDIQQAPLVDRYMSRVPLIGRNRSMVLAGRMRSGGIAASSTGETISPSTGYLLTMIRKDKVGPDSWRAV
jgi:hypothetical protein